MDYTLIAQKDNLKPVELSIKKMNNLVSSIKVLYIVEIK